MAVSLYRLAYFSRNTVPADADFLREMQRILATSRRNNALNGVTGALLFNQGFFGQILEGEYAAVERTFETIQNDERHGDVVMLQFESVSERGFGPWAMAHVGSDLAPAEDFAGMAVASDFDPSKYSGTELFLTLRGILVVQEGERRPA